MLQPTISLTSVFLLLGAAQGFFLALLLLTSTSQIANLYLALFLILFSFDLINEFLAWTDYIIYLPNFLGLTQVTDFLYGPLFYFYVKTLISIQNNLFKFRELLHFLPALTCIIYWIPFYLLNAQIKLAIYLENTQIPISIYKYTDIIDMLGVISMLIYMILSFKLLSVNQINIKLNWLRYLLISNFYLWSLYALSVFYDLMKLEQLLHLSIAIVIFTIGFKGLKQPVIFISSNQKYQKSSLTKIRTQQILDQLTEIMTKDKVYMDSELTLNSLAKQLDIYPAHHLSQVINQQLNKKFFDLINEARIEEAKTYLIDPNKNNLSILDIAMQVGFNSKSSFYTAFKKYVGTTPTKFKQTRRILNI